MRMPSTDLADAQSRGEDLGAAFVTGFRSAKTQANYAANLRSWFTWTRAAGRDPLGLGRRDVEAYIQRLEDAGYAANTVCQRISTLSSFYRWAVAEPRTVQATAQARGIRPSHSRWMPASHFVTCKTSLPIPIPRPPAATTDPATS